ELHARADAGPPRAGPPRPHLRRGGDPPGRGEVRRRRGVPLGHRRPGGAGRLLQPVVLRRPHRRSHRAVAAAVPRRDLLGVRGHRADRRPARPGPLRAQPGRHPRAAGPLGPGDVRRAGRHQARGPRRLRAAGRQRRRQPADPRPQGRRLLGARRREDLDRQRRDRRRHDRQRRRRPRAGHQGPGDVRRGEGHPGHGAGPAAAQARAPGLAHRRAEVRRLPHPRRPAARRRGQARAQAGEGPPRRRQARGARHLRADPPDGGRDGAGRGARGLRVRVRLRAGPRGVRWPDHRQPGRLVPPGRPRRRHRRRPAAHLARLVDGRQRRPVPGRRGLDVQAQGLGGRRARRRAGRPDLRRVGLRRRPAGGEVVPRRQALHDLRGHQRDPAHGHRTDAGRAGVDRGARAPPPARRQARSLAEVRPRLAGARPRGRGVHEAGEQGAREGDAPRRQARLPRRL
ncbi:MAG: Acyl-CoA dehydrogenase, short-chain specific, partial [uncultured Actinomycetospora sp.]